MLFGFGYLYKFVMFYFFFFFFKKKQKIIDLKKPVGQNFVILFFCFLLKIESVGPVDQQINLVLSNRTYKICVPRKKIIQALI